MPMKLNNQFTSIEQMTTQYLRQKDTTHVSDADTNGSVSFLDVLKDKQTDKSDSELKFSKHAVDRLHDRHIELTTEQVERLENGTKKANEKGIRESLMLMDELAFIISVKNNTVITAMDKSETEGNIFTNIDGAVII